MKDNGKVKCEKYQKAIHSPQIQCFNRVGLYWVWKYTSTKIVIFVVSVSSC